jgi:hypothetical protein
MANSKNKGNTFERKISKILSDRFKEITGLEQSFRRNIDSGSFFGGSNQSRAQTYDTTKATFGDIMCPEKFKFNLECKHYKTAPSFGIILKQENKQWDTWILQARQDCVNANQQMMLVIKYNGVDEFVFLEQTALDLEPIFNYKEFKAYALSDLLLLSDSFFFED